MSSVSVENVWKIYGRQTVLERISFEVAPKSFVALVGPSGCGKSTFLRMLLGDETPSKGRILVDGEPLMAEPSPDRGVVFQKYSVFPHLTCLQNVMLGLEFAAAPRLGILLGKKRREAKDISRDMLQRVGLGAAENKYPTELSGGMQQRLAIAQALVKKPKLLWNETGMTVFMVTHDLSEAFKLGTRVIAFDRRHTRPEEAEAYGATITFDLPVYHSAPKPADVVLKEAEPIALKAAV